MSTEETEESEFTEDREQTEDDATTDGSFTTGSYITTEDATDALTSTADDTLTSATDTLTSETDTLTLVTDVEDEGLPAIHRLPQELLNLEGRRIKAEDFEWGTPPVFLLADIIIEAVGDIESSDLEKFLQNASAEQKFRICELLPLDFPLHVTIPIIENGLYWKRMCLKSWNGNDVWRYSDNWKSMFVHKSVQELIENFAPDKDSISDLRKSLEIFSNYVTTLKITKLLKVEEKVTTIDVFSENFDQELDDIITAPQMQIYLDFENVLGSLPYHRNLTIALPPMYIDFEDFHFNNADFNSMLRALRRDEKLKMLRLSNRNFTNEQLSIFLKMLLTHNALTELNLSFNFIDSNTCEYIAKLLISDCPLECLVLMHNKITNEGAKTIAAALFVNSKLRKLDLSLNIIGDEGAACLAKVLHTNTCLRDFDLSKNKITAEGGIEIAELVKKSKTLRSLKIQENFLGEIVGKQFVKAIKENHTLLELEVHFCGFSNEEEGLIHQEILRNRARFPYSEYVKNSKYISASEFLF